MATRLEAFRWKEVTHHHKERWCQVGQFVSGGGMTKRIQENPASPKEPIWLQPSTRGLFHRPLSSTRDLFYRPEKRVTGNATAEAATADNRVGKSYRTLKLRDRD